MASKRPHPAIWGHFFPCPSQKSTGKWCLSGFTIWWYQNDSNISKDLVSGQKTTMYAPESQFWQILALKVISSIPWHKLSMYIVYHESFKASDGLVKDVLARFSLQTTHVLSVNNVLSIHGWSEI